MFYPLLKRFTYFPQVGLGLAFTWGIPMAFAAETHTVPIAGWMLFFTGAIWPIVYDTFYAMVDRDDDVKAGVKSTAIIFGQFDRQIIGVMQAVFLVGMFLVGRVFQLGYFYYYGLVVVALLFVYQQWLVRNREPACCFKAFLHNHWVGLVIFLGIVLG